MDIVKDIVEDIVEEAVMEAINNIDRFMIEDDEEE